VEWTSSLILRIKQSPEYDRAGWNNATIEDEDEYDYEAPSHQLPAPVVSTELASNLEAFPF
jgi:hypothetical protein